MDNQIQQTTRILLIKQLLLKQKEEGVEKRFKGFVMIDRGIPRQHYEVVNAEGEIIGEVTSGTMSPMMKQGIGMAYLIKDTGSLILKYLYV